MLINLLLTILLLNPVQDVYLNHKPVFDVQEFEKAASPERINLDNIGVEVTADSFVAIDVASGALLIEKNVNQTQAIASITKLMTALVILEQEPDWQQPVELKIIDETYGAQPHIYRGEEVRFIDLWKSALVASDNNSIKAMIRALGFSEQEFLEKMNQKALELEMYHSEFADPTGLDENNLSNSVDVARLLYAALQKNEIREAVIQGKYVFDITNSNRTRTIYNTDILIDSFLNSSKYGYELIGGKTGYLPQAGYCLSTSIKKDNHEVIIVVLNSSTIESRFQDVKVIADWVFSNYNWQ